MERLEDATAYASTKPSFLGSSHLADPPSRDALIAALTDTVERLVHLCAHANAKKLIPDGDWPELKRVIKTPKRTEVRTNAGIVAARHRADAWIADILGRFPADERAWQRADAAAALATARASEVVPRAAVPKAATPTASASASGQTAPIRRRTKLPIPLMALPSASLLEDLEAGDASWAEAVRPVPVPKQVHVDSTIAGVSVDKEIVFRHQIYERKGKMSARVALAELKVPITSNRLRWVQRLWEAPTFDAVKFDRRRARTTQSTALCPLVRALVLKAYHGHRGMTSRDIAKRVIKDLAAYESKARGANYRGAWPHVGRSSILNFLSALPQSVKDVRKHGYDEYRRQSRIVDRWDESTYANEIWETDHTPLPIAVVQSAEHPDEIVTPYCTATVDAYSGVPITVMISSSPPDAFTSSLALGAAIRRHTVGSLEMGGIPKILRPDHGADFMSEHLQRVSAALDLTLDPAAQHHPDGKPHVERFFRTLGQRLGRFPGYKPADGTTPGAAWKRRDQLLTMRQLISEVANIVAEIVDEPLEQGRGTPAERYRATVQWREPADPASLDLLLLKDDKIRTLTNKGVRFDNSWYKGRPRTAAGHQLHDLVDQRVVVRYHPDIKTHIVVYAERTGELIGEFSHEALWKEHIGAKEVNGEYLPALRQSARRFREASERDDRAHQRSERARELEDIKRERQADALAANAPLPKSAPPQKRKRALQKATVYNTALFADFPR